MSSNPPVDDLTVVPDTVLLELLREHERVDNERAARRNALVAQLDQRGLAPAHGCRDTKTLLCVLLRITPYEAGVRVKAAHALGPRVTLGGEVLEPEFPLTADALAAGDLSPAHARVIVGTVHDLPAEIRAGHAAAVEASLVDPARTLDPGAVAALGQRVLAHLHPDGDQPCEREQQRRRHVTPHQRPDGSGTLTADLDAGCFQKVLVVLDSLAKPAPETDGARDPRSAGQRRHDALSDACDRLLRSGTLPASGGVAATVVITMSADAWRTGRGVATTGHGAVLPAQQAIRLAGGDHRNLVVAINSVRAITAHGVLHRSFKPCQRLAMTARDGGCSFPGCTIPPAWCQSHHVREWSAGGETIVSNGTLLCGFHHRSFERLGWTCRFIDGRPAWIPPPWIDATQQPRRNTALQLELEAVSNRGP